MADIHAFEYLEQAAESSPFVVIYGDKPFLQQLCLQHLLGEATGEEDDGLVNVLEGDAAEWRDVNDELATVSLFGPSTRIVVVRSGDKFVTRNRDALEDYAHKPLNKSLFILEVKTWAGNTRLAKQVKSELLQIDCRAPRKGTGNTIDEQRVVDWIQNRARSKHERDITKQAARLLLELVEVNFGRMDQELAKLSLYVKEKEKISPDLVRDIVGGWRTKSTWDLADTIAAGDLKGGLEQLDALLRAGESPIGLLPQLSWSLRRFAVAARVFTQSEQSGNRMKLSEALEQAGFRTWPAGTLATAEKQLRRMKRQRALKLYEWLMEADIALKSTHSDPDGARFVLEDLCFKLR